MKVLFFSTEIKVPISWLVRAGNAAQLIGKDSTKLCWMLQKQVMLLKKIWWTTITLLEVRSQTCFTTVSFIPTVHLHFVGDFWRNRSLTWRCYYLKLMVWCFISALIVRHPFVRLISSWNEKYRKDHNHGKHYWKTSRNFSHYNFDKWDQDKTRAHYMSFKDFIYWLRSGFMSIIVICWLWNSGNKQNSWNF